ncbi:MAG: hypothetical protein OEZ43_20995 [Gammaproteobacteria bacterium]|nr:hypothetical protein [Gammaproteobacteria bacterium]
MSATAETMTQTIADTGNPSPGGDAGVASAGSPNSTDFSQSSETPGKAGDTQTPAKFQGPAERALNRARERVAAAQQNSSSPDSSGQAATGEAQAQAGDSTHEGGEEATTSVTDQAATSGESSSQSNDSDSTVTAPENWSSDWKAKFDALSDGASKSLVVDFYKEMQGGLSKSFENLAHERALAKEYSDIRSRFDASTDDAKAVLQELAEARGIEVYFDAPAQSDGELPEFNSTAELTAYMRNETEKAVKKALADRDAQTNANAKAEAMVKNVREQFSRLTETNPDWMNYRDDIISRIKASEGKMSAADAYALSTLPTLRAEAAKVSQLTAKVKALETQIENAQKRASNTVLADNGADSTTLKLDKNLSTAQRAHARAKQRMAKANARS